MKQQSLSTKVSSAFKDSASKAAAAVTPKTSPTTSFASSRKPAKPGPDLYVSFAQMHERTGNIAEAEKNYKKALDIEADNLPALLGYAHLYDRRGELEQATQFYKKAIAKHPKEASPYNDLGLCYHRRGMVKESVETLKKAVELRPDRKLYRNNLATVLVESGQPDEAFAQLSASHGPAIAHYNVGYLLSRKGNEQAALVHFQKALEYDPSLASAQQWIAQIAPGAPPRQPQLHGPNVIQAERASVVHPMPPTQRSQSQAMPMPPEPSPTAQSQNARPAMAGIPDSASLQRHVPIRQMQYPERYETHGNTGGAMPPLPNSMGPGPGASTAMQPSAGETFRY